MSTRVTASFLAGSLLALAIFASAAIASSPSFKQGFTLYKQGQYAKAVKYFAAAAKEKPGDSTIYYYIGNCYHRSGNDQTAKKYFAAAMQYGPRTPIAQSAAHELQMIDPAYAQKVKNAIIRGNTAPARKTAPARTPARRAQPARRASTGTSRTVQSSRSSHQGLRGLNMGTSTDKLPARCDIDYIPVGKHIKVNAYINDKHISMLFDTGAEQCSFGLNHLSRYGIRLPHNAKPYTKSMGVGGGGPQDVYLLRVRLRVGRIERNNFPIFVQKRMSTPPLLGQSFFKDFHYSIDPGSAARPKKTIHFVRNDVHKSSTSGGSIYKSRSGSMYEVPFRREGNEIVVQVEVEGKKCSMYFDTGAGSVAFTEEHLKNLGIRKPPTARAGYTRGVSGMSRTWTFPIRRIRMGPIDKRDFNISMVEKAQMRHPLLGQSFFGDWRYSIDNVNRVIKFRR